MLLVLWPLLKKIQLYCSSQFLLVEETEYPEKTPDMPQVTDKLYQIMLYRVHIAMSRIQTHNFRGDRH